MTSSWLRLAALGPPTYLLTRRLFLALVGLVYLAAFLSLWVQVHGLVGVEGIAPAGTLLDEVEEIAGGARFWRLPSLLWLWPSDGGLHALCALGTGASLLLVVGVAPRVVAAALWLLYLSLVAVGDVFLRYQWDALLLETGFLAIWLAPARLAPRGAAASPVEPLALFLLRFLLFKLMFLSGMVKLLSGDPTWRDLSAMTFHYFSQPLPSPVSFYAHHLPELVHRAEVVATFAIELVLPWLVFGPRLLRLVAFVGMAGLQLAIGGTGNYGFFNLLTFALCLLLLDDALLRRALPERWRPAPVDPAAAGRRGWPAPRIAFAALALLLLSLSLLRLTDRLGVSPFRPEPLVALGRAAAQLHLVNAYGLFAVMTTQRDEIALEGSRDGVVWQAYRFRWKPNAPDERPRFAGLHMPRLDWQLWFASLRDCASVPWFHAFLRRVLLGSRPVLGLLAHDPFPGDPPRFLRTPLRRLNRMTTSLGPRSVPRTSPFTRAPSSRGRPSRASPSPPTIRTRSKGTSSQGASSASKSQSTSSPERTVSWRLRSEMTAYTADSG